MNNNSLGYRALSGMLWGYIGKFSEFALAVIFYVIVGRTLGPVGYGHYNLFISIVTTFVLFSSLGFDAILNKFIPQLIARGKVGASHSLFRKIFRARFLIVSALGVIAWMSSSFLARFFSEDALCRYSLLFALLLLCMAIQNLLISFFNALLRLKVVTVVRAFSQVVGIAIVAVLFMHFGPSLKAALQAVLFSTVLSITIFLFLSMRMSTKNCGNNVCNLRPYLRFGLSVWLITLLTYGVSNTLNVLLMGWILKEPLQIGFYSTAVLFTYLPGNLISGWSKIVLPVMSEVRTKHGLDGISQAFTSFSRVMFFMVVPALLFLGRYANVLVFSMFGEKFIHSGLLIQVYVFFQLIGVMAAPHIGLNTLYALDKQKLVLRMRFIAGAVNIALVFLLAPPFKALGVMLACSIAVTLLTVAEFFTVRKYVSMKYPFGCLFKITMSAVAGLLLLTWFPVRNLTTVIIAGILYLAILLVIFHFIKLLTSEDKELLSRIHPALAVIVKHF